MNEANNEINSLSNNVDKLSEVQEARNTLINEMQNNSIILFKEYHGIANDKFEKLNRELENSKSQSLFYKIKSFFKSIFSKETVETNESIETNEKTNYNPEQNFGKNKGSLISKVNDVKNLINNGNEVNEFDNINNEGKGVEI